MAEVEVQLYHTEDKKGGTSMNHAKRMIETNPSPAPVDAPTLAECIEACFDCAQACTACADACIAEGNIQILARCIRLDLDCAEVCGTTGRILSRQSGTDLQMLQVALGACAKACRLCGEECERHADHMEHCRVCAEVCRRCESACNNALSAVGA